MAERSGVRCRSVALAVAAGLLLAACAGPAEVVDRLPSVTEALQPTTAITSPIMTSPAGTSPGRTSAGVAANPQPMQAQPPSMAGPPAGEPSSGQPTPSGAAPSSGTAPARAAAPGTFTIAFAGDVNFSERTADRLAENPATAFGVAADGLARADLTVVNLETAITTGGAPEPKSFTFRAPPTALQALADAGVDVASMANNHAADYGADGVRDSLAAIAASPVPVIGFGATAAAAYAPLHRTVNGVDVAIFAASQVRDHTLEAWTATADTPGIASAFDPALVDGVRAAAAAGSTVVVFLHWGTEYEQCPDGDQVQLADQLAAAGASAVIGAHAHVLQGAGWRGDGVYVAYGLSNYLWWRSFGNDQDDNGVLTLTFDGRSVAAASFEPSHLDDTGVPVPATGEERQRILAQWEDARQCTDLRPSPSG